MSLISTHASRVTTSFTETMAVGLPTHSTVKTVWITMSTSVTTVAQNTGTATDTTARMMKMKVRYIVTRTDLAHTSLAKVNTISALS